MKLVAKHAFALFAFCCMTRPGEAQSTPVTPSLAISGAQPGAERPSAAGSAVPSLIRFSGAVTDIQGKPRTGMAGLTFAIYPDPFNGAPLWLETQNVSLDANGRYTVFLGSNHSDGVPVELFLSGEARWLGVQPEGEGEQSRVLLVSVPYAMKAADADTLGGLPASSYVTAEQLQNQFSVASSQPPVTSHSSASDSASEVTPSPCTAVTSDGTALANYLTKFTAPCNIENSGLYQSISATTPGFIGIGTTTPIAPLHLQPAAQTGTTGGLSGEYLIANFNPTANSTGNYYGIYGQANSSTGNATNFTGDIVGSGFIAQHYGTGTVTNVFGANYTAQNRSTGTITNAVGFYGEVGNLSTGTITNGYGLWVPVPQNSGGGVFTNFYGVYIANPTGITNSWGLYSLASTNYMSGKLGIGVTAPTQALEINGNIKLDTAGHGITYPDGSVQTTATIPGSGTITGVTAGTDLTGGGTSGKVTVNLDATRVPTLAATTNTFTGTGGIVAASFTGDGTNVTNVNATELGGLAASGYAQLATTNGFSAYQVIVATNPLYALAVANNSTAAGDAIKATAAGSNAVGVYGEADNGVTAYGVEGYSASGYGVYGQGSQYGGYFVATGYVSPGVFGEGANDTAGNGGGYGGDFYGGTESSTGGFGYPGGYGISGTGGQGSNGAGGGSGGLFMGGGTAGGDGYPGDGLDVYGGEAGVDTMPGGYGIYAEGGLNPMDDYNYAAYFQGSIDVTGSITAGAKDFKIDHPLDPANKYLYHASVESSEMKNIYDGTATTDQDGFAEVRLPDWFEAVNSDFRYQLTVIGQFAQAIVAQKISSGRFIIRTDKPSVEVSWQVTGVRHDVFAKAHPLQVEVEKPQRERGYYVHPELYGAPHAKQVAFATHPNLLTGQARVKSHVPQPNQQRRPMAQNLATPVAHPGEVR